MNAIYFFAFCLSTLLVLLSSGQTEAQLQQESNLTTLTLAVFISTSNSFTGGQDVGRPFVEAVKFAVELINNDTSLLPDYRLDYQITDAQCDAGPSVRGYIDQIFSEQIRHMIIGADCSTSTEPIAELAPFWNLVQISPVSSSPELSRTATYSTFLRMVSSDVAAADGVVSLMLNFNWTRVAVLSQQENLFTSTFAQLREDLIAANITQDPREFTFNTNDDPRGVAERLKDSPTRIIFLNIYPDPSQEILCEAYDLGMTHANGYLWLFHAWYSEEWWLEDPKCDRQVIESMIEFSILIDHYASVGGAHRNDPTNATLTRADFDSILGERLKDSNSTSLASQAQFYFDAVWAAALALHRVGITEGHDLSAFTYDPTDNTSMYLSDSLYNATRDLQFTGMSGPVRFNNFGDRYPSLRYFQYRRNESDNTIYRNFIGDNEIRPNFPLGVPTDEEFVFINIGLFSFYTVLASVGVVFAVICLLINLIFKDKKIVKLSSPYLNVLIIAGVILFYIDVILFGIDEGTSCRSFVNALCMLRLWIASISFSLVFGTIFAKTWRVYYVFYSSNRHKKSKKTLIQDWVLFVMVGVLIAVDMIFMIIITALPRTRLTLQNVELPSNTQDLPEVVGLCRSEDRYIWLSVLFVYKGILLVIGVFLAFETRNVKIRELNDSKLISMSVYGILVLSITLAAVGLLLESHVDTFYAVTGFMVMLGNTSLLCLIFIPKFYGLWKDPDGLKIMNATGSTTVARNSSDTKETILNLNQEVQRLKQELRRLSVATSNGTPRDSLKLILEEGVRPPVRERGSVSFSDEVLMVENGNVSVAEVTVTFGDRNHSESPPIKQ